MDKYINEIKNIISKNIDLTKDRKIFIFGSRASGNNAKFSDYDIGFEGEPLSTMEFINLESAFEESDLPFTVDIVDFNNISEDFKKIAKKKIIPINYDN